MGEEKFFIDEQEINALLKDAEGTTEDKLTEILDRAAAFSGLSHSDVAALLTMESEAHWRRVFEIAGKIKEHIYGDRVVIFAPLYISDYCVNNCSYCGFNCKQKFTRRKLTMDEVRREVIELEKMGHKRLALEAGEDPVNAPVDYILDCIRTIYDMKTENGEIRRVNVNIAATTVENYRKLHDAGIGTYILFQETYHRPTYEKIHVAGPKSNYLYHTTAFDRAMEAGIDDVGGGVLFGFYDYRFEVMGLMLHNEHLEKTYSVGFHTISVPRLCDSEGFDKDSQTGVSDEDFRKIVAVLRLAVPYTGMIVSTRETPEMRKELIRLGVSQLSGGSSVEVGGYTARKTEGTQFSLADSRSARDIIYWLMEENLLPSFCTACYRKGRTGDRFMELARSGNIKNVCLPNALMTLSEFCADYGDDEFTSLAEKLIQEKVNDIKSPEMRELTLANLKKIKSGERDLFV